MGGERGCCTSGGCRVAATGRDEAAGSTCSCCPSPRAAAGLGAVGLRLCSLFSSNRARIDVALKASPEAREGRCCRRECAQACLRAWGCSCLSLYLDHGDEHVMVVLLMCKMLGVSSPCRIDLNRSIWHQISLFAPNVAKYSDVAPLSHTWLVLGSAELIGSFALTPAATPCRDTQLGSREAPSHRGAEIGCPQTGWEPRSMGLH